MKFWLFVMSWMFCVLFAVHDATAQQSAVPLDSAGRMLRLPRETAQTLGLLEEYPGFTGARLFRAADGSYVLDIELEREGRPGRVAIPMSAVEGDAWRARVMTQLAKLSPASEFDQEGRTRFLVGMAGLSFGFYSWAVPSLFGTEGAGAAGIGIVFAGGTYFYASNLTANARLTDGMATLALQGGYRGILDGFLLAGAIDEDMDFQGIAATATLTSTAELLTGFAVAKKYHLSRGRAAAIATYGNFGLGIGFGTSWLAFDEPLDELRPSALYMLSGTAIGYAAGTLLTARSNYSTGDVDVLTTAGLLGAAIPVCLLVAADEGDDALLAGAASAGAVAGLGAAHLYLDRRDFSMSQGYYLYGGTLAGGLLGAGLGYMLAPDDKPERVIAVCTLAGSLAGAGIMVANFNDEAEAASRSYSMRVNFSPAVLAVSLADSRGRLRAPLPFISVHASF